MKSQTLITDSVFMYTTQCKREAGGYIDV